ncbi:hypothetical protein G9A89_021847 [Geosiphon pyriformis]|nr:hypothetical protein G9A89_021847 [Geosiphon pyriformis]
MSVYMVVIGLVSRMALLNNRTGVVSSSSNGKIAASDLLLVTVISTGMVFDFVGANKLPETATDKWIGTVVDKLMLETNRLEVSIIAASLEFDTMTASSVSNLVDIELDLIDDLEFESGNWDFDIDFPIIGYLNVGGNQFASGLVYHNSDKYIFSTATVN